MKIGTGWQIYNSAVGAGDMNGDRFGDLLARDSAGVLWRYNGTGTGTLSARVKIGTGWQTLAAILVVRSPPASQDIRYRAAPKSCVQ